MSMSAPCATRARARGRAPEAVGQKLLYICHGVLCEVLVVPDVKGNAFPQQSTAPTYTLEIVRSMGYTSQSAAEA